MSPRRTRRLESSRTFVRQAVRLARAVSRIRGITGDAFISRDLAEKLMLTVSGVNDCEYCSYLHSQLALISGVDADVVDRLLGGDFDGLLQDEAEAILYAQAFADSGGEPDPQARRALVASLGEKRVRAIEAHLHAVYLGNLCSNAVNAFLEGGPDRPRVSPSLVMATPVAAGIWGAGRLIGALRR